MTSFAPLTAVLAFAASMGALSAQPLRLPGPDGKTVLVLEADESGLSYSVETSGTTVIERCALGLMVNGNQVAATGLPIIERTAPVTRQVATRGNHPRVDVSWQQYDVPLKGGWTLCARVFPDGIALRHEPPAQGRFHVDGDTTELRFPQESMIWTQNGGYALTACEGIWEPRRMGEFPEQPGVYTPPLTVELPAGGFVHVQEAAHTGTGWAGCRLARRDDRWVTRYHDNPDGFDIEAGHPSPWKVILVSPDLNGLVNNGIIASLAPPPDPSLFAQGFDTSWIKPGRFLWSWLDHHADHDIQYRYADMAAELGFESILVDDGWEKWNKDGKDGRALLGELIAYARGKGLSVWVWKRYGGIKNPDGDWKEMRAFFDEMVSLGVAGLKVDFMDSNSQAVLRFYDAALRKAAERKLMINFHGANTPGGEPQTWPNEMTREGICGLEWGKLPARHFAALPFTRMVAGHADFTGGRFAPSGKLHGTSWPLQMAFAVIFTSPALTYNTAPDDWAKAFPRDSVQREIVRAIPPTWDETVVLPGSAIGELAAFARRKGDEWFVAVINGSDTQERDFELRADFLPQRPYKAVILADDMERNDAWNISSQETGSNRVIKVRMRPTGGCVIRLTPEVS